MLHGSRQVRWLLFHGCIFFLVGVVLMDIVGKVLELGGDPRWHKLNCASLWAVLESRLRHPLCLLEFAVDTVLLVVVSDGGFCGVFDSGMCIFDGWWWRRSLRVEGPVRGSAAVLRLAGGGHFQADGRH